jgi:hypothetical protein
MSGPAAKQAKPVQAARKWAVRELELFFIGISLTGRIGSIKGAQGKRRDTRVWSSG